MKNLITKEYITATSVGSKWLLPVIVVLGLLIVSTSTARAGDDIVGTWRVTVITFDVDGNRLPDGYDYGVFHEAGTFIETSAAPFVTASGVGVWERIKGKGHGKGHDDDDDDDGGNGKLYALTQEIFVDLFEPFDGVADSRFLANATIEVQGDTWSATVSGPILSLDGDTVLDPNALDGTLATATRVNVIPE